MADPPFSAAEKAAGLHRDEPWPRLRTERHRLYDDEMPIWTIPSIVNSELEKPDTPFGELMDYIPVSALAGILEELAKIDGKLDEALWLQAAREKIQGG